MKIRLCFCAPVRPFETTELCNSEVAYFDGDKVANLIWENDLLVQTLLIDEQ